MIDNKPKVSVIMGVYKINDENILRKSIDSILNQTFSDFEFIICDDGSDDNTFELVKKICKEDSRVILIKNDKNKGLANVLNRCYKMANGEYIARMDADDESDLKRFERQVDFLDTHYEVDLIACDCNVFDNNGIYSEKCFNEIIDKEDFLFNSPIVHPTIMVRKKSLEKVGGYRDIKKTYRVEDYDLFMRMYIDGQKMCTLKEKLFNYREDINTYSRRKYKYRINEFLIRLEHFYKMGLLPKYFIYVIKPLIVGIIPKRTLEKIKRNKRG